MIIAQLVLTCLPVSTVKGNNTPVVFTHVTTLLIPFISFLLLARILFKAMPNSLRNGFIHSLSTASYKKAACLLYLTTLINISFSQRKAERLGRMVLNFPQPIVWYAHKIANRFRCIRSTYFCHLLLQCYNYRYKHIPCTHITQ